MQVSAEIRWYWRGAGMPSLPEWFKGAKSQGCRAGGGGSRTDLYIIDADQEELGVKRRGGGEDVEVKGLVGVLPEGCRHSPFAGPIEIWTKWASKALVPALAVLPTVGVEKRRWLRKFDTTGPNVREIALDQREFPMDGSPLPDQGCNVEYTEILDQGSLSWISLGFESFGALDAVVESLQRTAAQLSLREPPTSLDRGWRVSYPAWLRQFAA